MNLEPVVTYTYLVRTYMNLEPVVKYTYIVRTYMNLEPVVTYTSYTCPDKSLRPSMYRCMWNNCNSRCPSSKDTKTLKAAQVSCSWSGWSRKRIHPHTHNDCGTCAFNGYWTASRKRSSIFFKHCTNREMRKDGIISTLVSQ